ncbi:MAG: helix-turn-helix transcriptional regulator [Lachnospiraceae bacterium]|jgi:AraC-like DNA-binding protein
MTIDERMSLFSELVYSSDQILTWRLSKTGSIEEINTPDEETENVLTELFDVLGCHDELLRILPGHGRPVFLGSRPGLVWFADFEGAEPGKPDRIWMIGPVFYQPLSETAVEQGLRDVPGLRVAETLRFLKISREIPVASNLIMRRYVIMMHRCLTRVTLSSGELFDEEAVQTASSLLPEEASALAQDLSSASSAADPLHPSGSHRDRNLVYRRELAMLDVVREGRIGEKQAFGDAALSSSGVPIVSSEALRQAKTSLVVLVTLVSRAAMAGGLPPKEAYTVGDEYIQRIENTAGITSLSSIASELLSDFTSRVYHHKTDPKYSAPIRRAADYIAVHAEEKIPLSDLAALTGYSAYYLTRRFQEETGMSVNNYILREKIRIAKSLLRHSDLSIQQISDRLHFANRSYFSSCFHKATGLSPAAFRAAASGQNP